MPVVSCLYGLKCCKVLWSAVKWGAKPVVSCLLWFKVQWGSGGSVHRKWVRLVTKHLFQSERARWSREKELVWASHLSLSFEPFVLATRTSLRIWDPWQVEKIRFVFCLCLSQLSRVVECLCLRCWCGVAQTFELCSSPTACKYLRKAGCTFWGVSHWVCVLFWSVVLLV